MQKIVEKIETGERELSEPQGLKKEMAVWAKNMKPQAEPFLHRSDEVVHKLYFKGGIKNLFEQFIQKHKYFSQFFNSEKLLSCFNNRHHNTLERINNELIEFYEEVKKHSALEGEKYYALLKPITDNCHDFGIEIYFYDYMPSENHFRIHTWLGVVLEISKYKIFFKEELLVEKNYRETLSEEEITKFVNHCAKTIFEEIKTQAAK